MSDSNASNDLDDLILETIEINPFRASILSSMPAWGYVSAVQTLMNPDTTSEQVVDILNQLEENNHKNDYSDVLDTAFAYPDIKPEVLNALIAYATSQSPNTLTSAQVLDALSNPRIASEGIHNIYKFIIDPEHRKTRMSDPNKVIDIGNLVIRIVKHKLTSEETLHLIYETAHYRQDLIRTRATPRSIIDRYLRESEIPFRDLETLVSHPNASVEALAEFYKKHHNTKVRHGMRQRKNWDEVLRTYLSSLIEDVDLSGMPLDWLEATDASLTPLKVAK